MAVSPALVVPRDRDGNAAQKDQKRADYHDFEQRFGPWCRFRFPMGNKWSGSLSESAEGVKSGKSREELLSGWKIRIFLIDLS
jgi:hypothetical protein